MKKSFILGTAAALVATFALSASAAGFTKSNTYAPGQFSDVSADQWYAGSVSSAYELGFMKGSSASSFEPEGSMTVAEAITIASRVNDAYSSKGTAFDQTTGNNWYDCYVKYAKDAGIITEGQFDNYDRSITRAEMAKVFAKSVPADYLKAQNDVKKIPDVPSTNSYYEELKLLYNAGVIMGNDDYGTFKPTNNIIRAEAAAIIGRIAIPENRLTKTLINADYGDAYYLIDHVTGYSLNASSSAYDSPWQYDNRNRYAIKSNMANNIADFSKDGIVELWREIEVNTDGLLTLEFRGSLAGTEDGAYFMITDDNKNPVVNIANKEGKLVVNGTATTANALVGTTFFVVDTDLDNRTGVLYVSGEKICDFKLGDYAATRLYIGSTKEATSQITLARVNVYKNYLVNEKFVLPSNGKFDRFDEVTGDVTIATTGGQGYSDTNSAKVSSGGSMKKSFNKVSGDVVFEAYALLPNTEDVGVISLNSGDTSVASISVNSEGVFNGKGEKLRFHNNNIWQTLRIEADTVNGTVVYKVNGKIVGEGLLDSYASTVDNITVSTKSGSVYFDDLSVFMTHEYDDYVPVPKPVTDDGYDVILNICSLWREGQHFGWGAVSGYPDIEPALGYYDEGLVEVADWEIKFMVENGIDVQHLCWYSPSSDIKEPIKKSSMNDALHNGFFNAKYSDMMKFTFMWENTGVNCYSLEQFEKYIWSYWMDYYFLDDRFYTIDNKIVFTVWSYNNFKKSFGGTNQGSVAAVEWMNNDAKKHGFDGVMVFFADGHAQDAGSFKNMAAVGGSASYAYHWNQDGIYASNTIKRLDRNQSYGEIHIVPTVSVGFNNIGWSGVRKKLATLEDHKTVLNHIKDNYLPKLSGWKSNTLIVSTWNEYGEGTYVMPCEGLHGFGYLENVAEVISGVSDHSNNIYPTEQQKARLGHLYPKSKTSMKHLDYEKDTLANVANATLDTINADEFLIAQHISSAKVEDSILKVVADIDGAFKFSRIPEFDAEDIISIKVTMKSDIDANAQLFYMTSEHPNISEDCSFVFAIKKSDDFVEYSINTASKSNWEGTLKDFRFDPTNDISTYEIKSIEFIGVDKTKLPITIKVDNIMYEPPFFPVEENGELYVVADDVKGFFSLHNFYREWSRKTGKLYILTKNDVEIIFNIGSDVAIVDGKETKLKKAVELKDGLPVLPLFFLYDLADISYTYENKEVVISTLTKEQQKIVNDRVNNPYNFEFEIDGDLEGFSPSFLSAVVQDGVLKGYAIERPDQKPAYDPMFHKGGLSISSLECNKILVRMKHELKGATGGSIEIFFTTNSSASLSQDKSARAQLKGIKSDEFVDYIVDFSDNELWTGIITSIRLDVFNCAGDYEIDCVRFLIDEEMKKANEAKIEAEKQAAIERAEKGIVIRNGDAEDTEDPAFYGMDKNATVEIVNDPEKGNVWKVTAFSDTKVWAYMKQDVTYIPGATYKVSVDVKSLGTKSDKDANGRICCNVVYKDGANVDHVVHQADAFANKWTTITFTFKVAESSTDRTADQFCFYTNPNGDEGVSYLVDNITVSKT